MIGDIRGMGLLFAIEFVNDPKTRAPFPPDARVAYRVQEDAFEAGVMTYPMQGCVDGTARRSHSACAAFHLHDRQIHMLVSALEHAIGDLERTHLAGAGGTSASF